MLIVKGDVHGTIFPFPKLGVLSNWLARLTVNQVLTAWGFESLLSHFFYQLLSLLKIWVYLIKNEHEKFK